MGSGRVVVISQARMSSTRLPGKVMREVLGKPLLELQLERLLRVKQADRVVVATTTDESDQAIVSLCEKLHVPCFRGSRDDVLSRYHGAATQFGAEIVVRVTSDCPFIDPEVVDRLISGFKMEAGKVDYVANVHNRQRTYPIGFDAEVFSYEALDIAHKEATSQADREHVTPFIWSRPERFRLKIMHLSENFSRYRVTVDTEEDLELATKIFEELYSKNPQFGLADVVRVLIEHPDWVAINADVSHRFYR